MTHKIMPFFKIWLQAAVELILFFPIFMLLHETVLSVHLWVWTLGLTLFYLAGYCGSFLLHLNKWYSLGLAALCVSGVTVGLLGLSIGSYATGLVGFYLFFRGAFMANRSWLTMFQPYYYWSGLGLYFAVSVIYHFKHDAQVYQSELFWLGLLSVAITLFITSQDQIIQESLPEKTGHHLVNSSLLWHNRLLTVGLLGVITCVAAFRQLTQGFVWLNHWFWKTLLLLIHMLTPAPAVNPTDMPVSSAPPALPHAEGHPSAFMQVFEKILYYLILSLIAAAMLVCVYFIGKWILRYTRIVYRWLMRRVSDSRTNELMMGYEDESTKLYNWQYVKESYRGKVSDLLDLLRKRERKWSELATNKERVRYIYRQLLHKSIAKGFESKPYYTVWEAIRAMRRWSPDSAPKGEKLAQLYNRARYSNHPIGDNEVEELK